MGKSCAYGSETLWEYYPTMDNIVMAKMMHDIGIPLLPGSCIFSVQSFHYHEDSLFHKAIDQLFVGDIELDENEDEDERLLVIAIPELLEITSEEQDKLVEPLRNMHCERFDLEVETTLGPGELHVKISGSEGGYFYGVLKKFIQFKQKLDEKTRGVAANGPHAE